MSGNEDVVSRGKAHEPVDLRWILTDERKRLIPTWARGQARALAVQRRYRDLSDDDLFLAGFPKAGSTWLRFVLLELFTGTSPETFDDVNTVSTDIGTHHGAPRIIGGKGRLIKSHEAYRRVRRANPRGLCIVRDPRDVAVSLHHYLRRRRGSEIEIPLETFVRSFAAGLVLPYGAWDRHTASWLDASNDDPSRTAVIRYEDLLQDGPRVLTQSLSRLGYDFDEAAVAQALANNSATRMRAKERSSSSAAFRDGLSQTQTNVPFVRSATSGQWRDALSTPMAALIASSFEEQLTRLGYALR